MISILTTNIFSDPSAIEFMIKCLSRQTFQDFEWIFIDSFYNKNKNIVSELCDKYNIKNYIHSPMCGANHIARTYHWELYNNALLLSSNDLFLRLGMYRWFSSDIVELAVKENIKGNYINIVQKFHNNFNELINLTNNEIDEKLNINSTLEYKSHHMSAQCGMFSYSKNKMIDMNGNNEAGELIHHHEDGDLNSRWRVLGEQSCIFIDNAMYRIEHNKNPNDLFINFDESQKRMCGETGCLLNFPNNFDFTYNPPYEIEKFIYRDFEWVKCPRCGVISPINADEYLEYLKSYPTYFGPVGVDGKIGRNLIILNDDICKLSNLNEKIELLKYSHINKRYLDDTINYKSENNIFNEKQEYIVKVRSHCKVSGLKLIDRAEITDFAIKKKLKQSWFEALILYIEENKNSDLYILELLHLFSKQQINDIFRSLYINKCNAIITMKHKGYPDSGSYEKIKWWDDIISLNQYVRSDSHKCKKIRDRIGQQYQKYMNCMFFLNIRIGSNNDI